MDADVVDSHLVSLWMTDSEAQLLRQLLRQARVYLEFGSGGSTIVASNLVSECVISVEASRAWIGNVAASCVSTETRLLPQLIHVDIGRTKEWSWPADESSRAHWPDYHEKVWDHPRSRETDLCLIDGRFRVACMAQALLHCRPDTVYAIHDFKDRDYYEDVHRITREIIRAESLSVFIRRQGVTNDDLQAVLNAHRYDPR